MRVRGLNRRGDARGRTPGLIAGAVVAASLLVAAAPRAGADWLLTTGRKRIETRGPWRVSGQRVLYTDTNGTLFSLPLAAVNLEASRAATSEAARPPRPTAIPKPRQALFRLTDADVQHIAAPAAIPAGETGGSTSSAAGSPAPRARKLPTVILYSASWCKWCRKAKELLASLGVPFLERDIDRDPEAKRELDAKAGAGSGVPVLDIGGTIVRGYAPEEIRSLLGRPPAPG